jgi:hypothetical protein
VGNGFAKLIVIRVTDKAHAAPVHDGKVTVRAEMTCPQHNMPMYTKTLAETSSGTYRGNYQLVMPGQWAFHITVRNDTGDATTSALPVTVSR